MQSSLHTPLDALDDSSLPSCSLSLLLVLLFSFYLLQFTFSLDAQHTFFLVEQFTLLHMRFYCFSIQFRFFFFLLTRIFRLLSKYVKFLQKKLKFWISPFPLLLHAYTVSLSMKFFWRWHWHTRWRTVLSTLWWLNRHRESEQFCLVRNCQHVGPKTMSGYLPHPIPTLTPIPTPAKIWYLTHHS